MAMNEAAAALVLRMEEVYATAGVAGRVGGAGIMCGVWTGPQWEVEFNALKAALEED